jgi:hypothetical protein
MAFSLGVEFLNMRLRKVSVPVKLHESYVSDAPPPKPVEQAT